MTVKQQRKQNQSFNDQMVKKTVLPAIYLWLLAAGTGVAMGIWKPSVVLPNIEGFIALIAIIGGVAAPALQTVLRMWESEQTIEIDNMPAELKHSRETSSIQQEHSIDLEKKAQEHQHVVEKHETGFSKIVPIKERK